jgi:acetyl esterase/lipase
MNRIKRIRILVARLLSLTAGIAGLVNLLRVRHGLLSFLLWKPKMISEAFSPFFALAGAIGAFLGLIERDPLSAVGGLSGGALMWAYVRQAARRHYGFEKAFGMDWRGRIPPHMETRMLSTRWTLTPEDPPQVPWEQDIWLTTGLDSAPTLLADIWRPPEDIPGSGLGVIYLHGSGWHYGDKDTRTRRFFAHLAHQGHAIVDLAYTMAPKSDIFDMVKQVKAAIHWMKINGQSIGVRPDRVVLMGNSAGGHLALLGAYTAGQPEFAPQGMEMDESVRAVVSYYGPTDLITQQRYFERNFSGYPDKGNLLGDLLYTRWERVAHASGFLPEYGRYVAPAAVIPDALGEGADLERYRQASPIYHVGPQCPPTLQLQGSHDFGGIARDARRLHHALQAHSVPSVYVEFPNTEHAFDLAPSKWSPPTQAATYDTERFLALMI